MMRFGPDNGPVVVVALPLFEEANRTRAVAVAMMHALADREVACALPEMPGQGESIVPTEAMTLAGLCKAFEAAVHALRLDARPVYVAAIRGGALLGGIAGALGRWSLAPQDGPSLLRELTRLKRLEAVQSGRPYECPLYAGNRISSQMLGDLAAVESDEARVPKRVIRLVGDSRPADHYLQGSPPWRRAEPAHDADLSDQLAADIADWIRTCEGR